ncbi:replication initiation protein, partial [Enterococcus faecium]|nr:RepB family plasmid replication initiator protein [Enterococcus faecalis]HAP3762670.1 replication initiation protein [Enterococcus faecalis]
MANEIVKYHHELNTIPLRKFTPVEMNLFFSIVSRMREKGDKTVRFTFDQLKDLSNYKATANVRFVDDLKATYEKILSLRFGRRSESGLSYDMFVMFTEFRINGDVEEPYVDIRIYEKALPLLNNLDEWVRYSLQQFNELQSSYSKTMFRLLKQFRTKGFAYFSKEDFHELLDIPKSYQQSDVDKNVIKPIRQELTAIFKGLAIKKKYGKGRGKPVIGYQFSFKPEIKKADDFNKHAPTKEEQNRALAQADKQNEYEQQPTTLDDKILEAKRKVELLEQLKEL